MKSKTTITVETWQTTSLRRTTAANFGWCRTCGRETEFLTPDEAARRAEIDHEEVIRRIASRELHLLENSGRMARICAAADNSNEV